MSFDGAQLDAFSDLAKAIGLLDTTGSPNPAWFADPVGGSSSNPHGLHDLLANDDQRNALLTFVDEILGPPDREQHDAETWVPLFAEVDPHVTISAVVTPVSGAVLLGIGVEHTTAGTAPPIISTRVHVPIFQLHREGGTLPSAGGGQPDWLLIGRPGGRIEVGVDATLESAAPPPGTASLGGVAVTLQVPTTNADGFDVDVVLRDLTLPGAAAPQTFTLNADSLDDLGSEVFHLVLGLVRAQADVLDLNQPAMRPFAALTGLLGIRDVTGVPPFPLADLPAQGVAAVVHWVESVLGDETARDAWLGQLAALVGGSLDTGTGAVVFHAGSAPHEITASIGVRVETGTGGHPIVTPWVGLELTAQAGAQAALTLDVLRADTATGGVTAIPNLSAEAVFGVDAGGIALLDGNPGIGSLHTGIALGPTGRPAFVLTLINATVGSRTFPVLDLSTPQAALNAASSAIDAALTAALDALGPAGALIARVIGLDPPTGVAAIAAPDLLSNPVTAVTDYWRRLLNRSDAMSAVLGGVAQLITGGPDSPVPGTGTAVDPWTLALVTGVDLHAYKDGTNLVVDLDAGVTQQVMDGYDASATLGLTLLRADLTAGHVVFGADGHGRLGLARTDHQPAVLRLGAADLELGSLEVTAQWSAGPGLRVELDAPGLAVVLPAGSPLAATSTRVELALPTYDGSGQLVFPAADWDAVEAVLGTLLRELGQPVIDAIVNLLGWASVGPRLALSAVFTGDAEAAIETWVAELLLDCDRLQTVMSWIATVLSAGTVTSAFGTGSARDPYRAPVAGDPRAPAIVAWLDPDCPPVATSSQSSPLAALAGGETPDMSVLVAALHSSAVSQPDLADLLVGRDSLATGLQLLIERWAGTDGLVGQPANLPDGVTGVGLPGVSYDQLVALGSIGQLVGYALSAPGDAVVHVGCEATWATDRDTGTSFDATADTPPGSLPETGNGTWFVKLPTPTAAGTAHPELGPVGGQAALLSAVLARRTDPLVIVAYGPAAAAAIRVAATATEVTDVVTVGTPWGALAVDALQTGLGGDALRFLRSMLRDDPSAWTDQLFAFEAAPLQQVQRVVRRSADVALATDVPSADAEARRTGLTVTAVFGALDADTVARGIADLAIDGVNGRLAALLAAAAAELPHTALHVGVNLPVIDLSLAGLLVGIGGTIELCQLAPTTSGVAAALVRGVIVDTHLGVTDGWLVGGPGALQDDAEARWMSARIGVPLDGRAGDAELVLHEATGLGITRERWVVRADAAALDAVVTTAVPEVTVIISEVAARLQVAAPDVAALLEVIGLVRSGGLDPDGLNRLLHDTVATVRAPVAAAGVTVASALRALIPGATGSGSSVGWVIGPATATVDLATGAIGVALTVAEAGVPPITVEIQVSSAGVSTTTSIGALDSFAGGIQLIGHAGTTADLAVQWAAPGGATARRLQILPSFDVAGLQSFATTVVPSVLANAVLNGVRDQLATTAATGFDAALDVIGLLGPPDEADVRSVRVPIGLFDDPGAWLRHGIAAWRTDPATAAAALLDALAPLVSPGAPAHTWQLATGVALQYAASAGQLRLAADSTFSTTLDTTAVAASLTAGLSIGGSGPPAPVLALSVDIGGRGLSITLEPALQVALIRPAPATPLVLYPAGPGLGSALEAAGEAVIVGVLNALIPHRSDAGSTLVQQVATAVFQLGSALDLVDSTSQLFTSSAIDAFAADPVARLTARLPQLASTAAADLAHALDPGSAVVHVTGPAGGKVTLGFGATQQVSLTLDTSGPTPAVVVAGSVHVDGFGAIGLDELRLSTDGVYVSARIGPAELDVGAFTLLPLVVVEVGSAAGSQRTVGLGLALDDAAAKSVEFRWAMNATPPTLVAVTRDTTGEHLELPPAAELRLLGIATSIASGVLAAHLTPVLPPVAKAALQGVVFTDVAASTTVDPALAADLLDPDRLLQRLERMLWNLATGTPLSLTIGGTVTISLASDGPDSAKQLGVSLTLADGQKFAIASGDPLVELEVDPSWIDPTVPPGLTIYVLTAARSGQTFSFQISPAVVVAGVGLRFTKTSGPLLDLGGVSLDAIAMHVYAEARSTGLGGGVNLELAGLAFAPGGGNGGNGVANNIMNGAGQSSPSARPVLSPEFAVQIHPGDTGPSISLRAGTPPGPWWVVIQRQLGPLYLERVGFDEVENNGSISRITLLFDGRVSLFGFTASVDQLSLSWLGGDVLSISSWAVDLNGLAIAADMAGVSLSGGLLKTTDAGEISYVGMLMGRFGVYGLTVFGGYTADGGNPSFFVFGAVNGPIGGPPAFFVTGLGGGLGINRGLRVPEDVTTFNEYPFIKALDPAAQPPADPMAALRDLNTYFPAHNGEFWFAAGISFTCFALVDGIAVVAVAFGDGLEIDLLGLARMALPRPEAALVSIELGLLAHFSTSEGVFSIRAGLTENSWLLYEDVKLTGGFAFVIWWKGANSGQFVLTLGGYHPSFHHDGYPDVPRLGITWQVSDAISIKGGSYFALTSEAVMAGLDVEASADFGWAWARIAFGAHGIVYFDPFWFEVDAYARISAGVQIHTWLGDIGFSLSIGATITVSGPEFSGTAELDVGPASFSVGFGSGQRVEPVSLDWPAFVAKYLEADGSNARALSGITGLGTLPAATGGARSAPSSDGSADHPFEVFAEFQLSIVTTVPATSFSFATGTDVPVGISRSDGAPAALGLKPMRAGGLTSVVRVGLERADDITGVYAAIPADLAPLVANLTTRSDPAGSVVTLDAFPIGVWGPPDPAGQTAPALPTGDVLFAGSRLQLVAKATPVPASPAINYYTVESESTFLPLQATGNDRTAFIDLADAVPLPQPTTAMQALDFAKQALFAPRSATPPAGVLPTSPRSNLAAACFVNERTAPPMFGALTDGLAPLNGDDATADPQAAPTPPVYAGVRAPIVAGYLTAGSGVAMRTAGTTVTGSRTQRRPAPTIESVQSRLGVHLPVQLSRIARPAAAASVANVGAATVLATGVAPRTVATGATRSYAGPLAGLAGVVSGLSSLPSAAPSVAARATKRARGTRAAATAADGGQPIGTGDVVVLQQLDHSVDVSDSRPTLAIAGSARVTALAGAGAVLLDQVASGSTAIPAGAAHIVVQADGDVAVADGMAGWLHRSRVATLGSHAATGPGCVIVADSVTGSPGVGWTTADALTAGASAVLTQFSQPVDTVVVVVEQSTPERIDDLALQLIGADRVTGADGNPLAPTVVLSGSQGVLVYAVAPQPDAAHGVGVRVGAGGDWTVAGVLGGNETVAAVAQAISERGVLGVAGRVLATAGPGCTVSWQAVAAVTPDTKPTPAKPTPAKPTPVKPAKKTKPTPKKPAKKTTKKTTKKSAKKTAKKVAKQATKQAAKKTAKKASQKASPPRRTGR